MAVMEKFFVRTALLFSMNKPYFSLIPLIIWRMMLETIEGKGGIYCSYKKRVSMIYLQLKHTVRAVISFSSAITFLSRLFHFFLCCSSTRHYWVEYFVYKSSGTLFHEAYFAKALKINFVWVCVCVCVCVCVSMQNSVRRSSMYINVAD
jgi:hypothetical protein